MTLKLISILLCTLVIAAAGAQENYKTYKLNNKVSELIIKVYKAEKKDEKLVKGRFSNSRIIKNGSRIVNFDSAGNVTLVSDFNRDGTKHSPWYFFEKTGNTITRVELDYQEEILREKIKTFKNNRLFEYRVIDSNFKYVECFERYDYDQDGNISTTTKYDDSLKVVGLREFISRNSSKSRIEEIIIDCSPYIYRNKSCGEEAFYERLERSKLHSVIRTYIGENLETEYDESKKQLKRYDSNGNLIEWTFFDSNNRISQAIKYSYNTYGLVARSDIVKDGEVNLKCSYKYKYNNMGDWVNCEENCQSHKRILERKIIYSQ